MHRSREYGELRRAFKAFKEAVLQLRVGASPFATDPLYTASGTRWHSFWRDVRRKDTRAEYEMAQWTAIDTCRSAKLHASKGLCVQENGGKGSRTIGFSRRGMSVMAEESDGVV